MNENDKTQEVEAAHGKIAVSLNWNFYLLYCICSYMCMCCFFILFSNFFFIFVGAQTAELVID